VVDHDDPAVGGWIGRFDEVGLDHVAAISREVHRAGRHVIAHDVIEARAGRDPADRWPIA
jgi:hypothetical protein